MKMVYTPETSLDRVNLLKAGATIVITKAEAGRSKVGAYYDVECSDDKTYRTYSGYLMEDLKKLEKAKFDFSQGFAATVTDHVAEESGNHYLTFETPVASVLAEVLKQFPLK
jgi:hypothetical protein